MLVRAIPLRSESGNVHDIIDKYGSFNDNEKRYQETVGVAGALAPEEPRYIQDGRAKLVSAKIAQADPTGRLNLRFAIAAGAGVVGAADVILEGSTAKWASSARNAAQLAEQLRLNSARSPFNQEGKLTESAVSTSRAIIDPAEINNKQVPKGYRKYSTPTFQSPSGDFQVHFYKNPQTGEVFYGLDYKAIFNRGVGR